MMTDKNITLFGGTGFVGRYVVREAADQGYRIRVITRDTAGAAFLKTQGEVGQISVIYGDINKPESYKDSLNGADIVINLVGILFEKGKKRFADIHARAPEKLAQQAQKLGIARYLHMSALGVDKAKTSKYAKTKLSGEKAVQAAFPDVTIFRPSVIFGAEDNFYNQFACMSRFSPALPLIGGGETAFQPVYVGDVAKAFIAALQTPKSKGKIYELGGAETLTFREILRSIGTMTHRDPILLPIPSALAQFGATFAQLLPTPPLTRDQVELLKYDNVVSGTLPELQALGITPSRIEDIVPHYLERYQREHPDSQKSESPHG